MELERKIEDLLQRLETDPSPENAAVAMGAFEAAPLEILPKSLRLKAFRTYADQSLKYRSAIKALVTAQDYRDEAVRLRSKIDEARAHLCISISYRRMKKRVEASEAYAKVHDLTEETDPESLRLRLDLWLDQGIFAFQEGSYLESARLNQRAANIAQLAEARNEEARALLNVAVSWERLGELENARASLRRAEEVLSALPSTTLHGSFALFKWRLEIDHGPFPMVLELNDAWTRSQKTLYHLYHWEYAIYTAHPAEVEKIRQGFSDHIQSIQEKQFERESANLDVAYRFHFLGQETRNILLSFEDTKSLLEKRSLGMHPEVPEGFHALVSGWAQKLFLKGQWKKLEVFARLAQKDPHPFTRAWGYRAQGWVSSRQKKLDEALGSFKQALEEAENHHLDHLRDHLKSEISLLSRVSSGSFLGKGLGGDQGERPSGLATNYFGERILKCFESLFPNLNQGYVKITQNGHEAISGDPAPRSREVLQAASSTPVVYDGIQGLLYLDSKEIALDKKIILQRILGSIFEAFPGSLAKEDLVPRVWEEGYNPLVHENLIYTAISRLRRILGKYRGELLNEEQSLRWAGRRPFLAVIEKNLNFVSSRKLSGRQLKILTLLKYRGSLTKGELIKAMQTSKRTAVRDLSSLVDRKMIIRTGSGPSTRYFPPH